MKLRLFHISIAASIVCGALIIFLFKTYIPEALKTGESWAVLILDDKQEDRKIREALAGIGSFISESSQEILLDDFSEIRKIPLDSYFSEIEIFDPRNDGYAAKLSAFFVRDGMRFFFLSLDNNFKKSYTKLEKQIVSLLPDMPHSLLILGKSRSVLPDFLLLVLACIFALYLAKSRKLFVFMLPMLLFLALGGAHALLLAAILAGIWELLREPSIELYASRSYQRRESDYAGSGIKGFFERLKPFRLNMFFIMLFLLLFFIVSFIGQFFPFPAVFILAVFFLVYFLSCESEAEQRKERSHTLFTPVLLYPSRSKTFSFIPMMLPFIAASVMAMLLPLILPSVPGAESSPAYDYPFTDREYLVNKDDFRRHLAFQQAFSFQSEDCSGPEEYHQYHLGEDGLIAGSSEFRGTVEGRVFTEPPFPLEKLMDFLIQYSKDTL